MRKIDLSIVQACSIYGAEGFSLFLPYGRNDEVLLLADISEDEERFGFYLSERHQYRALPITRDNPRRGLYITDIRICVDVSSTYDAKREDTVAGSLIINGAKLLFGGTPVINNTFRDSYPIFLRHEEGVTAAGVEVGFLKWSVEIGKGESWQEYISVDVSAPKRAA